MIPASHPVAVVHMVVKKKNLLKWIVLAPIILVLFFFAGWHFQWSPISFFGFELAPPEKREEGLIFVPRVAFYDISGNPIEKNSNSLMGGSLENFSKILFLLSTRSNSQKELKIKFLDSSMALSDGTETKQIHQAQLGQEFVLFPNREITVDIANLNPKYLLEARQLNPNKKIDLHVITKIGVTEPSNNKTMQEKEIYIICKNTSNLVSSNYKNADLTNFYPSCLITNISEIK